MIARATSKATRQGIGLSFKTAVAEALPFGNATFDAVLSTLMLHHLPRKVRQQCLREILRVLKPEGRVLVYPVLLAAGVVGIAVLKYGWWRLRR